MTRYLSLALLALPFFSCNNDDDISPPIEDSPMVETANAWNPSTLGSYWIYQVYKEDENGDLIPDSELDSAYAKSDIFFDDGYVYTEFLGRPGGSGTEYIRAEGDYLLNQYSNKLFSNSAESELLGTYTEPMFEYQDFMQGDTTINFDLGELAAKYSQGFFAYEDGFIDCSKTNKNYWVKDIGLVRRDIFFASSCRTYRMELQRYHIEE